ncbi:MAG: helix-turn-helix domain-containing protein [Rickettsiaceae bacterium]|nr:helix-turn-helix domain-containing protein [Rickettsiaceae bacterium]
MNQNNKLNLSHLSISETISNILRNYFKMLGNSAPVDGLYKYVISEAEKALFTVALEVTGGNQKKASEIIDVNRNTLSKKCKHLKSKKEKPEK